MLSRFAPAVARTDANAEGRLTRALRLWVLLACRRANPRAAVAPVLGPAVPAFAAFMDLAVSLWPEPLLVFPPCAATLSPDESVLLGLLLAAAEADSAAADRIAGDLLDPAARARLFQAAARVTDALAAA
ncbi:MAG: hypothetical protein ACK4MT_02485 [Thermaurantiacus tibetensis]|uniref:hypothetical protein n=1 Tax=Thermaurantiacus tibetensis TaxID=2759035 RepID=UPI00188FDC44|nr:hypothetical protein [Thermaurantiacus tibetensis]